VVLAARRRMEGPRIGVERRRWRFPAEECGVGLSASGRGPLGVVVVAAFTGEEAVVVVVGVAPEG